LNEFKSLLPEITLYFTQAETLAADLRRRTISLGGTDVTLTYSSKILEYSLFKAFEHLECAEKDTAVNAFRIFACDKDALKSDMPGYAYIAELSDRENKILMYNSENIHALYNPGSGIFSLVNIYSRRGWYYLPQAEDLPFYEKAAPMRMLLYWLCETERLVLVHAAAVGWDSGALLFAGRGGTGKSTTAMLAVESGFSFLGDDYVVLENSGSPAVLSVYNSVKFCWEMLDRLPSAGKFSVNDSQADEKGYFFLLDKYKDSLVRKLPLKAVLLPLIEKRRKTSFVRVSSNRGLLGLAASSIFQMPGSGKNTLKRLAEILKDTPVYQMSLGTDNKEIATSLKDFLCQENMRRKDIEPA
jgi:hypothetical protein